MANETEFLTIRQRSCGTWIWSPRCPLDDSASLAEAAPRPGCRRQRSPRADRLPP